MFMLYPNIGDNAETRNRSALLFCDDFDTADPFIPLRSVRVVFENPAHNYTTTINGTRAEIIRYFVGARLCVCADPETLATVRGVEFLESGVSDEIL